MGGLCGSEAAPVEESLPASKSKEEMDIAQQAAAAAPAKLAKAEAHFHGPYQVGGKPKPPELTRCDEIAAAFGAALGSHGQNEDLLNLFAEDGSWTDPVPTPPHVGTEKLKERIANLPSMDKVEVKEVFYSMSPNIFLAKTEVTFTGKPPFIVLDRFTVA